MPIYEYRCSSCEAQYELRQGFDAATTHTCEECGNGVAKRVLHAPPIVFKGSGWYVTDSRNKSTAMTDSDTSATASESATKSEPKPSTASPEAAAAS